MKFFTSKRFFVLSVIFTCIFIGVFTYSFSTEGNANNSDVVPMKFDFLSKPIDESAVENATITYTDFSNSFVNNTHTIDITFENGNTVTYEIDGYDRRDFRSLEGFKSSKTIQSVPIEFYKNDESFVIFTNE